MAVGAWDGLIFASELPRGAWDGLTPGPEPPNGAWDGLMLGMESIKHSSILEHDGRETGISFKTRFKHVYISVSIYRVNWSMALYAKEIELTGNADRSIPLV